LEGKSLEYINAVSPLIWGARTPNGTWPEYVEAAVDSIGMNYDAVIKDIRRDPEKYDQVWIANQVGQQQAGHGGVPLMVFQGEPFFGQDRFDHFVWRLMQSGLTKLHESRPPFTTKPLRWPAGM
jgi:2-hydroxychromene-2-carboxylate isomerase